MYRIIIKKKKIRLSDTESIPEFDASVRFTEINKPAVLKSEKEIMNVEVDEIKDIIDVIADKL